MTEAELKTRLEKGEDIHTEFKSTLPDVAALAKSFVLPTPMAAN